MLSGSEYRHEGTCTTVCTIQPTGRHSVSVLHVTHKILFWHTHVFQKITHGTHTGYTNRKRGTGGAMVIAVIESSAQKATTWHNRNYKVWMHTRYTKNTFLGSTLDESSGDSG